MATYEKNTPFQQESHAHTERSDGPSVESYFSELENGDNKIRHVGLVDHISPEGWKHLYEEVGREDRVFIGREKDIRSRSQQLSKVNQKNEDVEIYVGAEIDTVPGAGWTKDVIERNEDHLDFAHVSQHFFKNSDNSLVSYKDGDFGGIDNVTENYFDSFHQTLDMLEHVEADIPVVLAHPGLPENNPTLEMDEDELRKGYENLISRVDDLENVYPELNLKTEERVDCDSARELEQELEKDEELGTTIWTDTLLDHGMEYTIGSDTHRRYETNVRMRFAYEILDPEDLENAVPVQELTG